MQVAWGQSARILIDRAMALAVERGARVTTLHLAAAMLEEGGDGARILGARGLRAQDLRSAAKVHPEEAGAFERVQSQAKRIAASRAAEMNPVHLLVAALADKNTALASVVTQLGCDPMGLAEEVLRASQGSPAARRGTIPPGAVGSSPSSPHAPAAAKPADNKPRSSADVSRAIAREFHPGPNRAPILSTRPLDASDGRPAPTVNVNFSASANANANKNSLSAPPRSEPAVNAPGGRDAPARTQGVLRVVGAAEGSTLAGTPAAGNVKNAPVARVVRPEAPARSEHDLDARTYPALSMFARNLSAERDRGLADPVVGRAKEVQRVLDAVARREGRGALVVGPAGVGKSTLTRALAREDRSRVVLSLRHAEIAAQSRGVQGAERARKLVEELVRVGERALVVLDPVAPWFLTRDVPEDVVLELRAALAAGKLAWVGTATPEEARKLADVEPWLERAALRVELDEPSGEGLREVVRAFGPAIGAYHGVVADAPVLDCAAELSERYLSGRAQPDRALNVVDLALARTKRARLPALSREALAEVVAELGGLPVDRVAASDNERLLNLESALGERVVGHAEAITRVAQTLRRNAVGFRGSRPIGTFLFLGPTGVGKTETAKAMAEALFPGAGAMTRFDMAEFSEAHTVARLVGAPPGYVGYQDGGQLTEAVRRKPYQLILLDEIEKAHRDVLESLLALLDEGRMTDGRGRTVDFRNTVIVLTSNLGADVYETASKPAPRAIGFGARPRDPADETASLAEQVRQAARAALPPELWNRIDDPVVFAPLTRAEVTRIAWRLLGQSFQRLENEQGIRVEATESVVELLLDNGGYEPALGARPMRRAIARLVEAPVADAVLRGALKRGSSAKLEARDWGVEVVAG